MKRLIPILLFLLPIQAFSQALTYTIHTPVQPVFTIYFDITTDTLQRIWGAGDDGTIAYWDAERLAAARPGAELLLIEGMYHVLKDAPAERLANIAVYSDPELPLSEGLMEGMVAFIRAHAK